jgi:hypothetical protein
MDFIRFNFIDIAPFNHNLVLDYYYNLGGSHYYVHWHESKKVKPSLYWAVEACRVVRC